MAPSHFLPLLRILAAVLALTACLPAKDSYAADKPKGISPRIHVYQATDDLPPGAVLRLGNPCFRSMGAIACIAFSPDGRWMVSGGSYNSLEVWDAATGKRMLELPANVAGVIEDVAVSPDGKMVAWASTTEQVFLWDCTTGERLQQLKGHRHPAQAVAFSPDGKLLASGTRDGTIHLWKTADGNEVRQWQSDELDISSLAFFPDGKTLVCGGKGIRLWETATGKEIHRGKELRRAKGTAIVSPDGKLLASGNMEEPTIHLWDATTGKELRQLQGWEEAVSCLAFSPDSRMLAAAAWSSGWTDPAKRGEIGLWDVATGKQLRHIRRHFAPVTSLAFSPDGKVLASAGGYDCMIRLWQPATGKELTPPGGHQAPLLSVQFSPDGKMIATRSVDRTVRFWDAATGKSIGPPIEDDGFMSVSVFSADGKKLAVGDWSGAIAVWDVARRQRIRRLLGHTSQVDSLMFSPDGKELASGARDQTARVWDLGTGEERQRLTIASAATLYPVFVGKGQVMTTAPEGDRVAVWDVRSGKKVRTPTRVFAGAEITHDLLTNGRSLVSWADRKRLWVWDSGSGKDSFPPWTIPEGRDKVVRSSIFSPRGWALATLLGSDACVRIWELTTGKERCQVGPFVGGYLAFSPDGRFLITEDLHLTVLVWDVLHFGRGSSPGGAAVPAKQPLTARELQEFWSDLAGEDAGKAYRAICMLVASPKEAVDFTGKHLQPAVAANPQRVAALLADLESDQLAVRGKATRELKQMGEGALPGLLEVMDKPPSTEVGQRVKRIVDRVTAWTPGQLRQLRAVEMLELIGSSEARQLLEKLAAGMPEARLTQAAQAGLEFLKR